jgi:hypothetical protein
VTGVGAGATLVALLNLAKATGMFEVARLTEFKSAPPNGLCFALWVQQLGAAPTGSGMAVTTVVLQATARLYIPMLTKPEELVEVRITDAADAYLGALSGSFTLGGSVRNIDLLGEMGEPMVWTYGYITVDSKMYRIADLPINIVINDAWTQVA